MGILGAQQVAMEAEKHKNVHLKSYEAFIEELIVRRELADNYCYYNNHYDSFQGFPEWAQKTLTIHSKDKREFLYNFDEFEKGKTHDKLWNAAQHELIFRGKLHGFMR